MQVIDAVSRALTLVSFVGLVPWFRPRMGALVVTNLSAQVLCLVSLVFAAWFNFNAPWSGTGSYIQYDFERYAQFYFEQSPSPSLAWTIGIYAQLISALALAVLSLREYSDSIRRRLKFGLKAIGVIAGSCVCLWLVAFFAIKMTGWAPLIYVVNTAFVVMPFIGVLWLMPVNASFFLVAANPRVWRETKAGPNRWAHSILFGSLAALMSAAPVVLAGQIAHRAVESCSGDFSCAFAMGGWVTMTPALALLCGLTAAVIAWRVTAVGSPPK